MSKPATTIGAGVAPLSVNHDARALAGLLELCGEAMLVHRRFAPLYANGAFARLFGLGGSALGLDAHALFALLHPQAGDPLCVWGAQLCAGAARGEARMRRADGALLQARYASRPLCWEGETAMALAIQAEPVRACARSSRNVLVISADAASLRRLRVLLGALGRRAACAGDAAEAAALARGARYGAVLMDAELAWAGARRLGAPLIGLARRGRRGGLAAAGAAGLDALIETPCAPSALARVLALLAPASVEAFELEQIEQEDRRHEHDDSDEGGHAFLPEP